jgi:ribosomal protein S18 acetylase RimI-like enzyme
VIRAGEPGDVEAVLALWRAAGSAPTVTDDEAGLAALLEHDPGALLVGVERGAVVGSLVAGWDGWRGGFYRLAVAPGARRRGLGTARISVIVDADDRSACAFWDAVGYVLQPDRARYVRNLR